MLRNKRNKEACMNDNRNNDDDRMFHPEQEPHLAEDGATPASPPSDIPGPQPPRDHPATDDSVDEDELYQEGLGSASDTTDQEYDSDWVQPLDEDVDDEDRHSRIR